MKNGTDAAKVRLGCGSNVVAAFKREITCIVKVVIEYYSLILSFVYRALPN
jgi:hypothetical protein